MAKRTLTWIAILATLTYVLVLTQDRKFDDCRNQTLGQCQALHKVQFQIAPTYRLTDIHQKNATSYVLTQVSNVFLEKFVCIQVDNQTGLITDTTTYRLWNLAI